MIGEFVQCEERPWGLHIFRICSGLGRRKRRVYARQFDHSLTVCTGTGHVGTGSPSVGLAQMPRHDAAHSQPVVGRLHIGMKSLIASVSLILGLLPIGLGISTAQAQQAPTTVKKVPVHPTTSVAGKDLTGSIAPSATGRPVKAMDLP